MNGSIETSIISGISDNLSSNGYEIFINPDKAILPRSFGGYIPDLVATKGDERIAYELARKSPSTERKLKTIRKIFENNKDWDLRIIWISSESLKPKIRSQSRENIDKLINELNQIFELHLYGVGMIMAWSGFEAVSRAMLTGKFNQAQTPARVVQVLASEGYFTPSEADFLRKMAKKRNALVHGDLDIQVSGKELKSTITILRKLVEQLGAT